MTLEPSPEPRSFLDGPRRLIAILIEGYATLNRRLWVLVVPIGLDLFLWLGPRLIVRQFAAAILGILSSEQGMNPSLGALWGAQFDPALLSRWGEQTNLFQLLAAPLLPVPLPGFSIPLISTLLPNLSNPAWPGFTPQAWDPPAGLVAGPLPLAILAVGLLLGAFYQLPLADCVRGSNESGVRMLRRVPRAWWRMLALTAMGLLAGGAFLVLSALFTGVATVIHPSLGGLVVYVVLALILFALLFLYFTPQALLLSWVPPLRAVHYSVQVVRHSFWSSVGFVLLVWLVRAGTGSLWQYLSAHPLGMLASIMANAYITTGLAAASLIFYRERLRDWLAAEESGQKRGRVL